MSIEQRIRECILIEKLEKQAEYGKRLGIEDVSMFRGIRRQPNNGKENKL